MYIPGSHRAYAVASLTAGGNWMQDVATSTASSADWMSKSKGPSAPELAANAFAAAQQIKLSNLNSMAVNKGIATLRAKLNGKVNVLA